MTGYDLGGFVWVLFDRSPVFFVFLCSTSSLNVVNPSLPLSSVYLEFCLQLWLRLFTIFSRLISETTVITQQLKLSAKFRKHFKKISLAK